MTATPSHAVVPAIIDQEGSNPLALPDAQSELACLWARWVRSVKGGVPSKSDQFGRRRLAAGIEQLCRTISMSERNHQAKDLCGGARDMGGLLRYYHREVGVIVPAVGSVF